MSRTATCPSCGAPVQFKSVASILAVCDYCQGTLLRRGEDLENLGKMAALIEDRSPLQRGSEGSWGGRRFALIGRIQLRYEAGLWNEWHLLFDDGRSGWLSEAGGEYVLSEPRGLRDSLPAFAELKLGGRHAIDGRDYSVTNILSAECVAGEGELPFKVGAGYALPTADLRDEAGGFATFDYSDDETKPLLFVGESVEFKSLGWSRLRENIPLPEATIKARAFNCPKCGAPLQVSHENIATVGCGSCGAVLDTSDERVKVLAKASLETQVVPALELGTKGRLRGEDVEVIGFMHRHMTAEGTSYYWSEYVLLGPDNKLIWLTEYDGHWNIAWVLSRSVVTAVGKVRYGKEEFKHFSSYTGFVDYVIGEFPWRVKLDEKVRVEDYVSPPRMLSRETTDGEETWTLAEYVEPAEIQGAFKTQFALAKPRGVYANQLNPHEATHKRVCRRFWMFFGLAVAIHLLLTILGPSRALVDQSLVFSPADDEPKLTAEFRLDRPANRLELVHDTSVDNNWVGLNATLVNKETGENWQSSREISRYSGVEDGESWSEGSSSDEVVFTDLPAGTYVLAIESDMDANARPVQDHLRIAQAGPRWSPLILVSLFLMAFPIFTRIRKGGFEVKRWAESDHPIVTSSSDDD